MTQLLLYSDFELDLEKKKAEQTLSLALAKVQEIINTFDLQELPFNMKLSLVKREEIPEHLLPPDVTSHALRLQTECKALELDKIVTLWTHWNIKPLEESSENIKNTILQLVFYRVVHELAELIKINGVRELNPHDPNSPYYNAINGFRMWNLP